MKSEHFQQRSLLTAEEQEYIRARAYIPEHIVSLMVLLSKGQSFLIEDYLCYVKDNWLIFVGYPLRQDAPTEKGEAILNGLVERFKPEYAWFIGKEVPAGWDQVCTERESDHYYKLDLVRTEIKKELMRMVQRGAKSLTVERSQSMSKDHEALIREFVKREKPNSRIKELFLSMPDYVRGSKSTVVLNARDKKGLLSAFYIVELGARTFATYLLGCHSKRHYVPQASDLLFFEMIRLARESGKGFINLGLGVNEGIRRFKEKWGGVPFLKYEFCERSYGYTRTMSLVKALEGKL